jgi:hypothetical protein
MYGESPVMIVAAVGIVEYNLIRPDFVDDAGIGSVVIGLMYRTVTAGLVTKPYGCI